MGFRVTIDQIAQSGGLQRHGPYESIDSHLVGVVEDALSLANLDLAEHGHYQITVTDLTMYNPPPYRMDESDYE